MTGRDRLVVIVIAAALVLGGFWFLALAPKRKQASDLTAQVATQQQRLTDARGKVVAAEQAKARYESDYAAVAALGQAVPADDDVPSLIVQVDRAAQREGVSFRSLALDASGSAQQPSAPAPAPAAPSAPAQATEKASGSDSSSSSSSSSSAAAPATPAPATQAAAATLPPGASVGPAGFPTMPFTFEFTGSFFRLEDFFDRVNSFTTVRRSGDVLVRGRLLALDSFDLKAAPSGFPQISASVHATAYVLPPGEGLTAGATAAGPAGDSAATGGGAPASSGSSAPAAPTAAIGLMSGGRR